MIAYTAPLRELCSKLETQPDRTRLTSPERRLMLDIKFIRENSEYLKTVCEQKRFNADIDQLLEVDTALRAKQTQLESLQSERNNLSKQIGKAVPEAVVQLLAGG